MQASYNPKLIEAEVQQGWNEQQKFQAKEDPAREKYYCLSMLPYPSGTLHIGHVRNYSIGDVISRFQRMQGKNVLQPMGWDAFGLPAENAAIKHAVPPAQWTRENIRQMREQLQQLGFALDWSREFATCDPDYYRWEQLMFTRLMKKGLVYNKQAEVNWDPVDQTVLANEQVIDGRGWRSGALVERREIPQWFLKITDYADELLDGLDHLPDWPEAVKTMQRNWIGRSHGAELRFQVADSETCLEVYTTRPDTLMGATYMAVAAQHPLALRAAQDNPEIAAFIEQCRHTGTAQADLDKAEKLGLDTGSKAVHPLSGELIPIWIANFVLMAYGTGAVMSVPAHDERDHAFASKYKLPIKPVVQPAAGSELVADEPFTGSGVTINSGEFDGLSSAEAAAAIVARLAQQGDGRATTQYRLRDWGVSRQRYWGCPIPVIYCATCGAVPVPEEQLPVVLPEDVEFSGVLSPLKSDPSWRQTQCPQCGGAAERETDTFDTFMESSWYYARYCCPGAADMLDERADYWLPVNQYIGGIEHAIMHLLYFRFYHKLLRDCGMVHSDEPATRLLCQGMVVAETYFRKHDDGSTSWYSPTEVDVQTDGDGKRQARLLEDDQPVVIGAIEKMSKSRNNGVNPQDLVERYGADTVRLFVLFAAPPEQSLEWSDSGVEGAWRFLRRIWSGIHQHLQAGTPTQLDVAALNAEQRELRRKLHDTIAKVSDDMQRRYTFNTAIAALMELSNHLQRFDDDSAAGLAVTREAWLALIQMLHPVTPHLCTHLWPQLGGAGDIEQAGWPQVDVNARVREAIIVVIQINGKVRGKLELAPGLDQAATLAAARADQNVQRYLSDVSIRKIIHVPDKLLNLVVG
ncbi:MAG: leucine--tRNA ligase [Gammaproteobacteria bacterium]|jgi:leucyl-tRNA synthetase|nr:leucine--tRNA ligase [Gammaproteobacteria bacterium]